MDPLSVTAGTIAVLQISGVIIKTCYNYRNDVKGARKEASRIIQEIRSLEQVLERLLEIVDDEAISAEWSKSGRLSTVKLLAEPDGPLQMIDAELQSLQEKLSPSKSRWTNLCKDLKWPLEEKELTKTLEAIDKIKSTLVLALSTDQTSLTLSLKRDLTNLRAALDNDKLDELPQKIYNWLGATDSDLDSYQAQKKRQPLTGNWLIHGDDFKKWMEKLSSFSWLYGPQVVAKRYYAQLL
ncbi:MAG: hypothetical protein M1814_005949 [Vezdaea aestivalis]|nr:MAG: hypothetical protein M1814_005949 [Vezdaea aestivalis]